MNRVFPCITLLLVAAYISVSTPAKSSQSSIELDGIDASKLFSNSFESATLIATLDAIAFSSLGQYTSIAIGDDGFPVISYYDQTNSALKVAKCNDLACFGGDETITTVDSFGDVGQYASIVIGTDGFPVISYYDQTNSALKVAKCNDLACFGGDETITTVDGSPSSAQGHHASIAIGADGLPIISYRGVNGALRVVKCNDPACSGGDETITTVDPYVYPIYSGGWHTSIAIGSDDLPVISYRDGNLRALKVAKCNDLACSGGDETITTVDEPTLYDDIGAHSSITIGVDGMPIISYFHEHQGIVHRPLTSALKVVKCNDLACSGGNETITFLDVGSNPGYVGEFVHYVGLHTSMTIGPDGLPLISYFEVISRSYAGESGAALKVAKCNDLACSNATLTIVDSQGIVGRYTSIALGADGLPVMSYHDSEELTLKIAKCGNLACR